MRVVLDTNILARVACSPRGPAGEVFDRIAADQLLILSSELLSELARVLAYERLRRIHKLDDPEIEQFVQRVEAGSLVVALPDPLPRVVPDDPDDDPLVAAAVAGGADAICTRNRHLFHPDVLDYCRRHGIRVLSDLDLLTELRASQPNP
ncbi:MAG: putative toxin-antitoxin system toxin component, PIN family [Planctomycetes bacterium]|nr:putative toxin-antitoxin system toxin component, PIN family [Planctomycetota bacterium]